MLGTFQVGLPDSPWLYFGWFVYFELSPYCYRCSTELAYAFSELPIVEYAHYLVTNKQQIQSWAELRWGVKWHHVMSFKGQNFHKSCWLTCSSRDTALVFFRGRWVSRCFLAVGSCSTSYTLSHLGLTPGGALLDGTGLVGEEFLFCSELGSDLTKCQNANMYVIIQWLVQWSSYHHNSNNMSICGLLSVS